MNKIIKFFIITAIILTALVPKKTMATTLPMVSLSWDKKLGLNIGAGVSTGDDFFIGMEGVYASTNISLKKQGWSVSGGHYITGLGLVNMRNGVNYKYIIEDDKFDSYFGFEHSMTWALAYYRAGIGFRTTRIADTPLYVNGSIGLGLF